MQPDFSSDSKLSIKKKPSLDVVSPRKPFVSQSAYRPSFAERKQALPRRKALDGVRIGRASFFERVRRRSLGDILKRMWRKAELYSRCVKRVLIRITPDIAPRKMLYGSLVGGVAFGMVSMAFMEHFFGPGVFARSSETETVRQAVAGAGQDQAGTAEGREQPIAATYNINDDMLFQYFNEAAQEQYEQNIREMVKGHPIEEMLPYIFEKDRTVAAFLIGIAKKESNWGKRVPVLEGQDCFNYWGYRGIRKMMGTGGHTCFNSRKDAVDTVAQRIEKLVYSEKLNTPEKMIIWKCGFSCSGHSRESVRKWISDVDMYFNRLNDE